MRQISVIFYVLVGILMGFYLYQYRESYIYIIAIALSFLLLNILVFFLYRGLKKQPMALMKFMGINFLKDILWAVLGLFLIKDSVHLVLFLAGVFILLSIPLYISILKEAGNNQKSDKNQS